MFINSIDTTALDSGGVSTSKVSSSTDPQAAQDRFLKLLVAQLNNQDPMNPLDNAQMTSQMAQINTVTGIQQLNQTMESMSQQFASMQAMQGTMMIGRSVVTEGSSLSVNEDGIATGGVQLGAAASNVKVEITTAGGQVVGQIELGAQEAGQRNFTWDASKYSGDKSALKFKVTATNAAGVAVESTPLAHSKVTGMNFDKGSVILNLENGQNVKYADVRGVA